MSLTRKQRANILLLDRSQNWSSTRSTTSHRATPLPDNSPFNRFIKPNHRQNYPIQTTIKGMTFASKDGMFTNSCAYTGRGALWEYSKGARQNVIKDEPVNPIIIKADMLSIQELEAMNSQDDKYIREAKLFIPIIMKKLEDYRQRKANGENIDPSKVLTESEKVYLRTMNPQSPEFRNIVLQLTKSGILAGILGIVGASPAAAASAAISGTRNPLTSASPSALTPDQIAEQQRVALAAAQQTGSETEQEQKDREAASAAEVERQRLAAEAAAASQGQPSDDVKDADDVKTPAVDSGAPAVAQAYTYDDYLSKSTVTGNTESQLIKAIVTEGRMNNTKYAIRFGSRGKGLTGESRNIWQQKMNTHTKPFFNEMLKNKTFDARKIEQFVRSPSAMATELANIIYNSESKTDTFVIILNDYSKRTDATRLSRTSSSSSS